MQALIALGLMFLSASAFAFGGKKASVSPGSQAKVQAPADDPSVDFAHWCQKRFGHLSPDQSQCVTSLNYRFGKKAHRDLWNSSVTLAAHDTVSSKGNGAPRILVGLEAKEVTLTNGTFVADQEGVLAFAGAPKSDFSVTHIFVKRCFDSSGRSLVCASETDSTLVMGNAPNAP